MLDEQRLKDRNVVMRELHDLHKISVVQISDLYLSDVVHEDTEPKLSVFGQKKVSMKNKQILRALYCLLSFMFSVSCLTASESPQKSGEKTQSSVVTGISPSRRGL